MRNQYTYQQTPFFSSRFFILTWMLLFSGLRLFAQTGEDCANAIPISVASGLATCSYTSVTSGTAQNGPNALCSDITGNVANDDRWYSFVAPSGGNKLVFTTTAGTVNDWVMEVWNGCPGTGIAVKCSDDVNGGMPEISMCQNEYTAGQTYYVRVWTYSNSASGNMNLCVYQTTGCAVAPSNDECINAARLTVGVPNSCPAASVTYTTQYATTSTANVVNATCDTSTSKNDVWFVFNTGNLGDVQLTISPLTATDLKAQVMFECGGFQIACYNQANGTYTITGLNPQADYIIRVWSKSGSNGTFKICLSDICANPTASLSSNITICNGQTGSIPVTFTGAAPYTFTYSNGTTTSAPITTSANPYSLSVNPTSNTTYSLVSMNDATCTGTVSGTSLVSVVSQQTVTLSAFSGVCWNAALQTLSGGSPGGGVYSGTNVSAGKFDPSAGSQPITYTVTFAPGCTGSATQTFPVYTKPTATLTGSTTVCTGQSADLTINLVGVSPWNITYSNGTTNTTVTANSTPYTLTVTPTATTTYSLVGVIDSRCTGTVSGTATVTVTSGQSVTLAPFTPVCSNAGLQTLTGGSPAGGTYSGTGVSGGQFNPAVGTQTITYTANAGTGCSGSATQVFTVNTVPTASISGTQSICPGANATISIAFTGTGPFNYAYSNGTTTTSGSTSSNPLNLVVTPSATTTYTLVSVSNASCSGTVSGSALVTVYTAPTVTQSAFTPVCINAGLQTLSGGSPVGGTYSGTGVSLGKFDPSVGTQTINYTVSYGVGCTKSTTALFTVNPLPSVSISPLSAVCVNASSFSLTGGSPAGGTYSGTGVSAGVFSPATAGAGTHTITYTYTNGNGCTNSASTTITVNALPTVTMSALSAVCVNAPSFTLTGGSPAGGTYSGTGVSAGVFNPATAGVGTRTITYTYTNANGCTNSTSTSITVNPLPSVTMAALNAVCINSASFALSGGLPAGGTYSGNGVNAGVFSPATAGAGTHTITYTYTNANGCTNSTSTTITVNPLPAVSLSAINALCINAPAVTLSGGSPAGGTYSGTGVSAGVFNPATAGAGTHTIAYTYTNANGCTNSASTTVTVNPLPTVSMSALSAVCVNASSITLSGGSPAGGTYSGTGVSAGVFNPATAGAGTHTITYTYTNGNGCTNSASTTITVNPLPTVSMSALSAVCVNASSITLSGGSPAGGTYSGTGVSAGVFSPAAAGAGTHTITYTYTNGNGCTNSASTTITVNPLPTVSMSALSAVCVNASSFTLTGGSPAGGTYSGTGVSAGVFSPATAGAGTHATTYTYTNANGCTSSASTNITVNALPVVTVGTFAAVCNNAASFTLTGGSPAGGTYSGTGVSAGSFNPAVAGVGTFTITYTYTNGNGCTASASNSITVNNCTTCSNPATANAGLDQSSCNTNAVTLNGAFGGGASSASWSNGLGTFSPNANTLNATYTPAASELTAGQVKLVLSTNDPDGTGPCLLARDTVVITLKSSPASASVNGSAAVCLPVSGISFSVAAQTGVTYNWTVPSGVTITSGQGTEAIVTTWASNAVAGSVCATITNSCGSIQACKAVSVNASPTAAISGTQSICPGASANLVIDFTGVGPFNYVYFNGTNNVSGSTSLSSLTISVSPSASTTYSMVSVNNSSCSGTVSGSAVVTVYTEPTVTLSAFTPVCSSAGLQTLSGGSPAGGVFSGTGVSAGTFNPAVGTQTITYTVSYGGNCSKSASQVFTVNALPTVTLASFASVCDNAASFTLSGGSPVGGTYSGTGVSGGVFNPAVAGVGSHTITYTYTNGNGCTNSAASTITVSNCNVCSNPATANAGADKSACNGSAISITGAIGGSASSATWSGGAGSYSPSTSSLSLSYTPTANEVSSGQVTLYLATNDPDGTGPCSAAIDTMVIRFYTAPGTQVISGPANVCRNSGNFTYSVPAKAGTVFSWTVPSGVTIVSGQGTNSIQATWTSSSASSGSVCVVASNPCGTSAQACKTVGVYSALPFTIARIYGPSSVCPGQSTIYYVRAATRADYYIWTPPAGATINGSSAPLTTTDTMVTVVFSPTYTSDTLRVTSGNCKGVNPDKTLAVLKRTKVPAVPVNIIGNNYAVCLSTTLSTRMTAGAATYTWRSSIPGTLFNGQAQPYTTFDTTVSVVFPSFTTATVYVKGNNGCGSSAERSRSVYSTTNAADSLFGPDTVCSSQTNVNFFINPIYGATSYTWTVPSVMTILSGQGTTSINVQFPSNTSNRTIIVKGVNACGTGLSKSKTVIVRNCVRIDQASSGLDMQLQTWPNPAQDQMYVTYHTEVAGAVVGSILDLSGRVIQQQQLEAVEGENFVEWNTSSLSNGMYLLRIKTGKGESTTRIVIER